MRTLFVLLTFLTILPAWAQNKVAQSAGMPTIEVDFFTRMEKRLAEAVVTQNRPALEGLLADDFELRTARSGGELTLRDEWLHAAVSSYKVRSYRIDRLTVRQCNSSALVNFFYQQDATVSGKNVSGEFFIVDLWNKVGSEWKITARYSAGPGVARPEPANVKTKE